MVPAVLVVRHHHHVVHPLCCPALLQQPLLLAVRVVRHRDGRGGAQGRARLGKEQHQAFVVLLDRRLGQ
eukprot:2143308-Rhodomonas_salina.1